MAALLLALPAPAQARDVLGIFGQMGRLSRRARRALLRHRRARWCAWERTRHAAGLVALRVHRLLAAQGVRGQVNIRLGRQLGPGATATMSFGDKRFALSGGGADLWAKDRRDDAAIVAALRTGGTMSVHGRGRTGESFSEQYELRGAATAIDAAALGCARVG